MVRQAASLEVTLNDGTGRIRGRYFVSDPQPGELEKIVPGRYVSAFGGVRSAPVQHLAITGLRLVESTDEVSYHVIEAAHAALKLQRKSSDPKTPAAKKSAADEQGGMNASTAEQMLTPQKTGGAFTQDVGSPYAAAAPAPVAELPLAEAKAAPVPAAPPTGFDLRAAIMRLLRDDTLGPEGLSAEALASKLGSHGSDVVKVAAELVDDGEIFSTIDEQHFAAV